MGFSSSSLVADRGIRPVAAQPHGDRLAGLRIGAQFARAGGLAAVDRLGLLVHLLLERQPEPLHQRHPGLLAATDRIELVLELGGEVVVDVLGEMLRSGTCSPRGRRRWA